MTALSKAAPVPNTVAKAVGQPNGLTYEDYAIWMAERGDKAINRHQWNLIIYATQDRQMLVSEHLADCIVDRDFPRPGGPSPFSLQTKDIIGTVDGEGKASFDTKLPDLTEGGKVTPVTSLISRLTGGK